VPALALVPALDSSSVQAQALVSLVPPPRQLVFSATRAALQGFSAESEPEEEPGSALVEVRRPAAPAAQYHPP